MQRSAKLKIRAPRKFSANQVDFATHWEVLQRAIGDIFQKSTSQLSFEELYRNAYILVLHKYGEKLYNHVQDVIRSRDRKSVV